MTPSHLRPSLKKLVFGGAAGWQYLCWMGTFLPIFDFICWQNFQLFSYQNNGGKMGKKEFAAAWVGHPLDRKQTFFQCWPYTSRISGGGQSLKSLRLSEVKVHEGGCLIKVSRVAERGVDIIHVLLKTELPLGHAERPGRQGILCHCFLFLTSVFTGIYFSSYKRHVTSHSGLASFHRRQEVTCSNYIRFL